MIKKTTRFDAYAYNADGVLDDSVDKIEEGQWVTYNDEGKLIISDGDKKSFLAIGSLRPGRDQVSAKPARKIAYLVGNFRLDVSNFDPTGDYSGGMTPLKVAEGGVLTPLEETDGAELIAAYAKGEPQGEFLTIFA